VQAISQAADTIRLATSPVRCALVSSFRGGLIRYVLPGWSRRRGRLPPDAIRERSILAREIGGFFADHDADGVSVTRYDVRHDRCIGDAQPIEATPKTPGISISALRPSPPASISATETVESSLRRFATTAP